MNNSNLHNGVRFALDINIGTEQILYCPILYIILLYILTYIQRINKNSVSQPFNMVLIILIVQSFFSNINEILGCPIFIIICLMFKTHNIKPNVFYGFNLRQSTWV